MKLSVIIPVYNVADYLERCIDSVLRQTFRDMEIIMVDDGSTDDSGALADRLAERDGRIRVIHQKNQGLSGARNTGFREAVGEYVVFLDSDDEWLVEDGLERMMGESAPGCDLIVFEKVEAWSNGKTDPDEHYDIPALQALPDPQAVFTHLVNSHRFCVTAWSEIVRREFLLEHDILFPLGLIAEDLIWTLNVWRYARTVTFFNIGFYCWYHRPGSITTTASLKFYTSYDKIFLYWKEECKKGCAIQEPVLSYLANIWVSGAYVHYQLRKQDQPEATRILERHQDLLGHAITHRAHRAAVLVRLFGVHGTTVILGVYWRVRTFLKRERV